MYRQFVLSGRALARTVALGSLALTVSPRAAVAYTPESPEVRQAVARGVKYLERQPTVVREVGR